MIFTVMAYWHFFPDDLKGFWGVNGIEGEAEKPAWNEVVPVGFNSRDPIWSQLGTYVAMCGLHGLFLSLRYTL